MKKTKKLKIMAAGLAISMIGHTMIKNSSFSCLFSYQDKAIITFDEVELNSIFFHKTIRDKVTLDDIILTSQERNIKENTSFSYQQIIHSIKQDSFAIQQLHIEENLSDAFLAPSITKKILKHQNKKLYDKENNDIIWDKVLDIWIKNSEERVRLDQQYQKFSHSQNLYLELSSLEKDKIQAIMYQMREFIDKTKEQIPTLDMKRVACQLEEMSFCYTNQTYPNALLVSEDFTLLFPDNFGLSIDIESMKKDLFHEFKHLLATPCEDEINNRSFYLSQTGIYSFDSNHKDRMWYYLPFDWLFLEEAGAETFSSELVNQLPVTYKIERQFEQDLLFGISLMPDFDKDILVKCSLLHNPIALLQQFPIPNSNQEEWLYQNAKMIECDNILANQQAFLNYILNIEELEGYENTFKREDGVFSKKAQEILLSLEDTADLQLMRIFLVNIMNSSKNMTLQDYQYLYALMDMRIQNHRDTILSYYDITIEDKDYKDQKEVLKKYYIKYLSEKFHQDILLENIEHLEEMKLSNTFSKEEQSYYYALFKDSISPIFIDNTNSLDKILTYYLGK